jgi:hypothetical protein
MKARVCVCVKRVGIEWFRQILSGKECAVCGREEGEKRT